MAEFTKKQNVVVVVLLLGYFTSAHCFTFTADEARSYAQDFTQRSIAEVRSYAQDLTQRSIAMVGTALSSDGIIATVGYACFLIMSLLSTLNQCILTLGGMFPGLGLGGEGLMGIMQQPLAMIASLPMVKSALKGSERDQRLLDYTEDMVKSYVAGGQRRYEGQ